MDVDRFIQVQVTAQVLNLLGGRIGTKRDAGWITGDDARDAEDQHRNTDKHDKRDPEPAKK